MWTILPKLDSNLSPNSPNLTNEPATELSSKLLKKESELSAGGEETSALKKELDSLRAESDAKDVQAKRTAESLEESGKSLAMKSREVEELRAQGGNSI